MVYPLFSQSIAWGVARKHILAFLFSAMITEIWLRKRDTFNLKDASIITSLYACSVLSQPISVLWPCWALVHLLLTQPKLIKNALKVFVPLFLVFTSVILINYFYYELSPVFLSNNRSITKNSFNFADCILATGHYVFQIFYPYLLSYRYTLSHWATLFGLVILGFVILIIRSLKIEGKWAITWGVFTILPIIMALTNPTAQYDTYLLIPSLGALILFISLVEKLPKLPKKIANSLILGFVLFWSGLTNLESRTWQSELAMVKKSFERRPSCLSAGDYLSISYENEKQGPVRAKNYILNYDCNSFGYMGKKLIILQAYMLFYESDLPLEYRLERLGILSKIEFFPHAVLASLYLTKKMYKKANIEIDAIELKWKDHRFKPEYVPIIALYLAPYCNQNKRNACMGIADSFTRKAPSIFYK
jgi:hypothetical protein